jgi:chromate transporter
MDHHQAPAQPQTPVSLAEAARFWLQLGLISFGGPAGQIALLHSELVDRRRWLSERRYLHALNYCMLLPGPEATQLATYIGWLMHGTVGGLLAGGLFVLPAVVVLTALATIYVTWGELPLLASVFWVLQPAVVAIVLQAAVRVGSRTLFNRWLAGIALAAFLGLTLLQIPFPAVIAAAAFCGWLLNRWRPALLLKPNSNATAAAASARPGADALHNDDTPTPDHGRFSPQRLAQTLLIAGLALAVPLAGVSWWGGWDGVLATMARFFTRVALVSFGGAYAVLPYVAQGAVERFQWLSASQMVDGLALGETTPGPLIMVVAFVGFMGGWSQLGSWGGAVAATLTVVWFTFLPSFVFILAGAPLVESSRGDLRLGAPLTAITAAVVGVIVNLALLFARPVLWPEAGPFNTAALLILLGSLLCLLRWRWSVLQLIAAAAGLGVLRWALALLP